MSIFQGKASHVSVYRHWNDTRVQRDMVKWDEVSAETQRQMLHKLANKTATEVTGENFF